MKKTNLLLAGCLLAAVMGSADAVLCTLAGSPNGSESQTGEAAVVDIGIENFSFGTGTVTVSAGTTVKWINRDDIPHTVVSVDALFKSGALDTDDSFSHRFDKPGAYDYFCSLHPKMTGKVVVR